jgi:hypothetical protein
MKRVLLDHCVPRRVRQALVDCDAVNRVRPGEYLELTFP